MLTRKEINSICKDIGEATVSEPISDKIVEQVLEKYLHPSFKVLAMIEKMFNDDVMTEKQFITCKSVLIECNKELQGE